MSFCCACSPKDDFPNCQLCPFILRLENLAAIFLLLRPPSVVRFPLLRPSWDLHWLGGPRESCLLFHSCAGHLNTNRVSVTQDLTSHPTIWHIVCFHYGEYKGTVFTWLLYHILNQSTFSQGTGRIRARYLAAVREHSFTNLSKVPSAYTSWQSSSETKGMGTMKEYRRPFLGSNFKELCVQS